MKNLVIFWVYIPPLPGSNGGIFYEQQIPEIVNIFSNSQNVSYMKGRTYFLMRKRDQIRVRKYNDIEMGRKEEDIKAIEEYEKKIKELEDVVDQYDKRESGFLKDKENLVILYQKRNNRQWWRWNWVAKICKLMNLKSSHQYLSFFLTWIILNTC